MNVEAIKAFVKAQKEMGKALKQSNNPAFRAKYADLGNVQDACFPALHANGFAVVQPNGVDESGEYVETVFWHETGERFSTRVYLRIGKNDMQGYGSAMTYARRYGLMNLAGIAPEDDDGNEAAKNPPRQIDVRGERRAENHSGAQENPSARTDEMSVDKARSIIAGATDLADLKVKWGKLYSEHKQIALQVESDKEARKEQLTNPPEEDPFGLPPLESGRAA